MTTSPMRFETLIERHHDEIYAYLWRLLNNAGQADPAIETTDLAQDVFLRAYKAFGRLRPDSNYRAWLYKIAYNTAMTHLKRENRHSQRIQPLPDEPHIALPDPGPLPLQQVLQSEVLADVQAAIGGEEEIIPVG